MQPQIYKDALLEAIQILAKTEIELFTAMVNLAFSGEYAEISSFHREGEVLDMELAMFEETGDVNVNHFSTLVKQMTGIRITLMNLNAINEDEIEI